MPEVHLISPFSTAGKMYRHHLWIRCSLPFRQSALPGLIVQRYRHILVRLWPAVILILIQIGGLGVVSWLLHPLQFFREKNKFKTKKYAYGKPPFLHLRLRLKLICSIIKEYFSEFVGCVIMALLFKILAFLKDCGIPFSLCFCIL